MPRSDALTDLAAKWWKMSNHTEIATAGTAFAYCAAEIDAFVEGRPEANAFTEREHWLMAMAFRAGTFERRRNMTDASGALDMWLHDEMGDGNPVPGPKRTVREGLLADAPVGAEQQRGYDDGRAAERAYWIARCHRELDIEVVHGECDGTCQAEWEASTAAPAVLPVGHGDDFMDVVLTEDQIDEYNNSYLAEEARSAIQRYGAAEYERGRRTPTDRIVVDQATMDMTGPVSVAYDTKFALESFVEALAHLDDFDRVPLLRAHIARLVVPEVDRG